MRRERRRRKTTGTEREVNASLPPVPLRRLKKDKPIISAPTNYDGDDADIQESAMVLLQRRRQQDDQQLLRRYIATRDQAAFQELERRYRRLALSAARRVLRNRHDAEDVAQATFLDFSRSAHRITISVPAWLYKVATRNAIDHLYALRRQHLGDTEDLSRIRDLADESGQRRFMIRVALGELPAVLRLPLVLRFFGNYSEREIAKRLKVNRHIVGQRLREGYHQMSKSLAVMSAAVPLEQIERLLELERHAVSQSAAPAGKLSVKSKANAVIWWKPLAVVVGCFVLLAGGFAAMEVARPTSMFSSLWSRSSTVDLMYAAYGRLLRKDPAALNRKIAAMAQTRAAFWRGSRDPFFAWVKRNPEAIALANQQIVVSPGNIDITTLGWYAAGSSAEKGFSFVDAHGSASIGAGIDLLQAAISLRIVAEERGIWLANQENRHVIDDIMMSAYERACAGDLSAAALASAGFPAVPANQQALLDRYVVQGKFRSDLTATGWRRLSASPADNTLRNTVSMALGLTINQAPEFRTRFASATLDQSSILDIASVEPVSAVEGGEACGIDHYLVLLRRPLIHSDQDLILLFSRHLSAAAERQGITPLSPRTFAWRASNDWDSVAPEPPLLNGWCRLHGDSYLIRAISSFDRKLGPEDIKSAHDLNLFANVIGAAVGESHRRSRRDPQIDQVSAETLSRLADQYVEHLRRDFKHFRSDDRVRSASALTPAD